MPDPGTANQVALDGEWDLARRSELNELLSQLTTDRRATIDLRACTYADSTVLNALVSLRVKFADVPVILLGPSPTLMHILKVVGFDKLFRITNNESD
jgi:anti-anti-sigma factor